MKQEIGICQNCPIKFTCSDGLAPERFNNKTQRPGVITPQYYQYPIICRHYTCNDEGLKSAQKSMSTHEFTDFRLFDGRIVSAVAFGSKEKQTAGGGYRIVDTNGDIYSLQEDTYYPTGQNAFMPMSAFS